MFICPILSGETRVVRIYEWRSSWCQAPSRCSIAARMLVSVRAALGFGENVMCDGCELGEGVVESLTGGCVGGCGGVFCAGLGGF